MFNVELSKEDLLALDQQNLPESLRAQINELKAQMPVTVEVPRDFYEDMQGRATALNTTPETLIVSFCRRWISVNSNAPEDAAADDDRCAHYDCSHRKEIELPPIVLSETEESHIPIQPDAIEQTAISAQPDKDAVRVRLKEFLREQNISSPEFAYYVGVSAHTIAAYLRGNNIGIALCNKIVATMDNIDIGEIKTDNYVAEHVIPKRIQKYKADHNMSNSDIGALFGFSETTVHRLCHGTPVSTGTYRSVRNFFKI